MQARSKKLEPVVKHVDKNEQNALQAVAFSQQQLKMQLEVLQKLHAYKQDYLVGQGQLGTALHSALQLQEFHRFLAQLDETIRQQQQVVAMAQREVEVKRQKWQQHRAKSKAMHLVVERIQSSEQHKVQMTEQKFMDEISLRNLTKPI